MFAKSMKGEDIARKLIHLLTEYDISSSHLVAAIHNRASVNDNDVAMRRIVNSVSLGKICVYICECICVCV